MISTQKRFYILHRSWVEGGREETQGSPFFHTQIPVCETPTLPSSVLEQHILFTDSEGNTFWLQLASVLGPP